MPQPQTPAGILQAFHAAVAAFNAINQPGGLAPFQALLDPAIVLQKIDGTTAYRDIVPVMTYITNTLAPTNPKFHPITSHALDPHDVADNFGYVRGVAKWKDDQHDQDGNLSFDFGFSYDGTQWLLLLVKSSKPY
jgi:hypothetical protein